MGWMNAKEWVLADRHDVIDIGVELLDLREPLYD